MDPLRVVEVQDGVHLRRGRPGGARPRHGEREQDARRREDEVVLVPLDERRVEVGAKRIDRANRRRRVRGRRGHPLDVGDRDRVVAWRRRGGRGLGGSGRGHLVSATSARGEEPGAEGSCEKREERAAAQHAG